MSDDTPRQRAGRLLEEALGEQMARRYENAIVLYKRSLDVFPTAEAHTFLGWAYSYLDRLEDAIEECRRAIALDPDFGNPYNDIGSYLMKQGKLDEAIAWLQRAKEAARYEPRHYPYLNLARLYAAQGRFEDSQRELAQARFLHDELFGNPAGPDGAPDAASPVN
jgi:tetratricopeptide (TPR) repeat protein